MPGLIFSTAARRTELPPCSARCVAAFMAGDAPHLDDESTLTERTFLALEESARLEAERASARPRRGTPESRSRTSFFRFYRYAPLEPAEEWHQGRAVGAFRGRA